MTDKPIKNIAASVHRRLNNNAKMTGRPFQEVFQYYAMERFLYRLAQSPHAIKFVLKGALMFVVWRASTTRPTRDIDLLGRMSNSIDVILPVIRDVVDQEVEPDGLRFDASSIEGRLIKEDADYEGVRVIFQCFLDKARVPMQIDIGFGDAVVPDPILIDYPIILDMPSPRLYGYSRETVVAEKFEAMVKLGQLNSRMKDIYDLWTLAQRFEFTGPSLCLAMKATFDRRQTLLPVAVPLALTPEFAAVAGKQAQWQAFLNRSRLAEPGIDLLAVIQTLGQFTLPPLNSLVTGQPFDQLWLPQGPWKPAG